jgi:hypothetical protein
MVWSEYVQETIPHANEYIEFSDDDGEIPNHPMTVDEWTTWFSQDLLNMWMSLRAYREDSGTFHDILKNATYTDFCEFCYYFSRH